MKKLLFPLVAVVAAIMALSCSQYGGKSIDPAYAAAVKAKIESRDFRVCVNRIMPLKGPTFNLTWPYDVKISGDSVYSYLPYFGEAYTPVIGRPDGLDFNSTMTNYRVTTGKKDQTIIKFTTRTFEDFYDYTITVYPNGNAMVDVYPNNKSSVTFDGAVCMYDEEEL